MAKVEFLRIFGISDEHEFLLLTTGMLVECATGSAALLTPQDDSFAAFLVKLMRGELVPCGAVAELKFHGVIKFHDAVVVYATTNRAAACPKGGGAWGVNSNPTSSATATKG